LFRSNRLFTDWHNKTKSRAMPAGGPCLLCGLRIHIVYLYVKSNSRFPFFEKPLTGGSLFFQLSLVFIPKLLGFKIQYLT
jgi:hypothetical protein